jgi:processive 1,2-diacylglycerol beta-glucosyltransferase
MMAFSAAQIKTQKPIDAVLRCRLVSAGTQMASPPRILIVTAAFGEGHNSAARNLALALNAAGAVTQVSDPCVLGTPRLTAFVNGAYRYVTTNLPQVWARIYRSTDRCDLGKQNSIVLRKIEAALLELIEKFQPDALVSTYPLYPYFFARFLAKSGKKIPAFVVVTDSIEINATWLRADCGRWLVTDPATRDSMIHAGLSDNKIIDTGFPVNPVFADLTPLGIADACDPFRILYFPTAKLPFIRRHARALLEASPKVRLTMVMGRNVRKLYSRAREIQLAYPGRVRLIGWTRKVPQLLNEHHLVIGKAGGATVHEAIAARCPMLIHHLVPGQEEGNLRLLEIIESGHLADSPDALSRGITELLADNSAKWRKMKIALAQHDRNAGAITAAEFILDEVKKSSAPK